MYNAGEADEGLMSTHNLLDAQTVGSDENTHLVCMNFRSPWIYERFLKSGRDHLGTHSYYVTRNADDGRALGTLRKLPELQQFASFLRSVPGRISSPEISGPPVDSNASEASTLKSFLLENIRRYPAEHYALILSGHGAGFAGQAFSPAGRISNEQLGDVLREVAAELGKPIDVLNLNTCYGAGLETLQPLQGGATVAVASESTVSAANQSLAPTLTALQKSLQAGEDVSAEQLGKLFVEQARYQPLSNLYTPTLSAVRLDRIESVASAVEQLHAVLLEKKIEPALLRSALSEARKLDYASVPRRVEVADLGSFAGALSRHCEDAEVRERCQALQGALEGSILAEQHANKEKESPTSRLLRPVLGKPWEEFDGLSGLSIYYDDKVDTVGNRLNHVKDTDLGKRLQIERFLQYLSQSEEPAKPGLLQKLGQKSRQLELKLHKSVGVPYVVPVAKWALRVSCFLGTCAALNHLGVPVSEVLLGPWFAGSGFWAAGKNAAGAAELLRKPGPLSIEDREKLVDSACLGTMGITMGTFGLHMMGLLPASVVWPVVGVATAARAARFVGKALSNRTELGAHREQARQFAAAGTVAEKLAVAARVPNALAAS